MYNENSNPLCKFKLYIFDPLYVRETGYFVRLREFENVLHHLEKKGRLQVPKNGIRRSPSWNRINANTTALISTNQNCWCTHSDKANFFLGLWGSRNCQRSVLTGWSHCNTRIYPQTHYSSENTAFRYSHCPMAVFPPREAPDQPRALHNTPMDSKV